MSNRTRLAHLCIGVSLVAVAACSARGEESSDTEDPGSTVAQATTPATTAPATTAADGGSTMPGSPPPSTTPPSTVPTETTFAEPLSEQNFGTLATPCGDGDATIAEDQNGDDGVLRLGTASDKTNDFSPGLTQEMHDGMTAFADWCNGQGGIQGLEIEIIDLDGGLFKAAAAMETACDEAFAMVGGGLVFDDQEFPRFHECKMIDFAGYTVTPKKADSNGMVQPIPNPPSVKPVAWLLWAAETYPEAVKRTALLFGDIDTTKVVAAQLKDAMQLSGWNVVAEIPVGIGEANWTPFAQQLKDQNIRAISFTGEPRALALLVKAMDEVGYRPELILQEANFYDRTFPDDAGEAGDGVFTRTAYAPFEEADRYPGMAAYLAMMEEYNPDGKIAGLGLQAVSAGLLFATSANACLDRNDGVLERECVLAEGMKVDSWTGGGLHSETNPASREPPPCTIIMENRDGAWQRAFPELGGEDDNGNGFFCDPGGTIKLEGDYDDRSAVDPDRPN